MATDISSSLTQLSNSGGLVGSIATGIQALYTNIVDTDSGRIEGGSTHFPENLFGRNDITQFTSFSAYDLGFADPSQNVKGYNKNIIGSIFLPLPKEMRVSYDSSWSHAAGGLGEIARGSIKAGVDTESILAGSQEAISNVAGYQMSKLIDLNNIGQMLTKQVVNPMAVALWQAPEFRKFTFTWDFVPISATDSEKMRKVIFYFKKLVHTPSSSSSMGLKTPPIWDIKFMDKTKSEGNKHLFQLKDFAITNVSIDYYAKGSIFHRDDHAPNGVTLSLDLMETSVLTQADFGGSDSKNFYPNYPTP